MAEQRVEAVERALKILEVFDAPNEAFTLAELAEATGFYKSTLLRLLASLERFGYVTRGADGRFSLGPTPLRLGRRHRPSRGLAARVQPVLDQLCQQSGETAALLEIVQGMANCRLVSLPDTSLRHELHPGDNWAIDNADAPAQPVSGGFMLCAALGEAGAGAGDLWLSLSGPSGRLQDAQGEALLDAARIRLTSATNHHQGGAP
ncbi:MULTISPECIES: helix-turn-helix domain-containing protein [Halomonadaceae]|uniref:IclR-like helix-turn-helix domain-containing protein n=1 Tax=Onishia taeanensis TaxID=284577 RepID=A0A328XYK0_9GAMM|nr:MULTISPECIES: helix-turn-helix domain-containing protein [Halomonas]RAR64313.1 IclR-like helix-turn-helix domain-containing protein [Halomonas taeanensis]